MSDRSVRFANRESAKWTALWAASGSPWSHIKCLSKWTS